MLPEPQASNMEISAMTSNDEWLRIQEQARKDAEAGRQRSNEHTSNGRLNDLYNNTFSDTKKSS